MFYTVKHKSANEEPLGGGGGGTGGQTERVGERARALGKLNKSVQSMKNQAEFLPNLADKLEQLLPSDILTSARYPSIWTNHCGGFPRTHGCGGTQANNGTSPHSKLG